MYDYEYLTFILLSFSFETFSLIHNWSLEASTVVFILKQQKAKIQKISNLLFIHGLIQLSYNLC